MRPQHTNALGTLFGGELMAWVDIAAATAAMRHAEKQVVTASIDELHFLAPIRLGWLVLLDASVNYTSRTSCEVGVKVTATHPTTGESHHTASAYMTFVALDSNGKPSALPPVIPETEEEKRRYAEAAERRKHRLAIRKQIEARRAARGE